MIQPITRLQTMSQIASTIITDCSGINATDHVKMSDTRTNQMGGQSVYINKVGTGAKFIFQIKDVVVPFGISSFQTEQSDTPPKLSIDVSFRDLDNNIKLAQFHRFVKELDDKVMNAACNGLLGATKSMEVVSELFRSTIRSDPNGKYSDTMKFNINTGGTGGTPTRLYNDKKEEITLLQDSLTKGAKIDMIVEVGAVYIIGKKNLGITWRVPQIRIKEMGDKLMDYAFIDSEDEDDLKTFEQNDTDIAV